MQIVFVKAIMSAGSLGMPWVIQDDFRRDKTPEGAKITPVQIFELIEQATNQVSE